MTLSCPILAHNHHERLTTRNHSTGTVRTRVSHLPCYIPRALYLSVCPNYVSVFRFSRRGHAVSLRFSSPVYREQITKHTLYMPLTACTSCSQHPNSWTNSQAEKWVLLCNFPAEWFDVDDYCDNSRCFRTGHGIRVLGLSRSSTTKPVT